MCGRFCQRESLEDIIEFYDVVENYGRYVPRYNIAPSQHAAALSVDSRRKKVLRQMQWGWPPAYQRAALLINARSETLRDKKTFHEAFFKRRCLVPATGFYEWDKSRNPFYFMSANKEPIALAALWELAPGNPAQFKFVIVTTAANGMMRPIHERMPVTLNRDGAALWLSESSNESELFALCAPCADDYLKCFPVSDRVNRADYEFADCIVPCPGLFD